MLSTVGLGYRRGHDGCLVVAGGHVCIATAGFYGTKGPFWAMPAMMLTGAAAASGLAFINAFGKIGGAMRPAIVRWLKDTNGGYWVGLYGLAAFTSASAVICTVALHTPRRVGAEAE